MKLSCYTSRDGIKVGGRYFHYKGNEYVVLMLAKNTETMEAVVVYRDRFDATKVWVRPLTMFLEKVSVDGEWVNRFQECPD